MLRPGLVSPPQRPRSRCHRRQTPPPATPRRSRPGPWRKTTMLGEVAQPRRGHLREPTHQQRHTDGNERQNRRHFQDGEPEFELPKFFTPSRLIAVKNSMKANAAIGTGTAGQTVANSPAAPTAGGDHDHQLHPPQPADGGTGGGAHGIGGIDRERALVGLAAAISPRAFITMITSAPATRYDTRTAGPAACTPTPEPRNSPAPMALPRPIMISWRGLSECPRREGEAVGIELGIGRAGGGLQGDTLPCPMPAGIGTAQQGLRPVPALRHCHQYGRGRHAARNRFQP